MKSHTSDSSLSCNKCEFKSQTMNNLTLHNRNEHTDANVVGAGFSYCHGNVKKEILKKKKERVVNSVHL